MSSLVRKIFYYLRGLEIVLTVTSPWDLWLPKLGIPRVVSIRNDLKIRVDRTSYASAKKLVWLSFYGAPLSAIPREGFWTVDVDKDRLTTPGGLSFTLSKIVDPFILAETFVYGVHFAGFDLAGKTVVDAGANIGDTALYYASLGATVYAYEPDPDNYATMTENLGRNSQLTITPRPFAVGNDGTVEFHAGLRGGSGIYAVGGKLLSCRSISLRTLLETDGIKDPYLLKADCKGSEYDLVQQPEVARFHRVLIEFDAPRRGKDLDFLLSQLRLKGFRQLRVYKHNWWGTWRTTDHGVIDGEH